MADRVGQQIGNYRLVSVLGSGGFADVYLGQHVHVQDLQAAIKVLREQLSQGYQNAFLQEAQIIARLQHPHIIRILDFGRGDTSYLIMEYAPQGTLRKLHPRGSIVSPLTVVSYINQIAPALQYAHVRNRVHRDLKPENFLIVKDGRVVVSDFGIAEEVHNTSSIVTEAYAGTVLYSAPEQIAGKSRAASDQYSLAVVVYEWLCGYPPFMGNKMQVMYKHTNTLPQPLRERVPSISAGVEQVVMTALAKDPHQRFVSIQAFARALEQASRQGFGRSVVFSGQHVPDRMTGVHGTVRHEPQSAAQVAPAVSTAMGNITANRRLMAAGIILLLILLLGAGIIARFVTMNQFVLQEHGAATATAVAQMATAQSIATATARAESNPYTHGGTLVLNDPLRDNNQGHQWEEGQRDLGFCQFTAGAYHVTQPHQGFFHSCIALNTNFTNFVYEVHMTLITGDYGGIVFRADRATTHFYYFRIAQDGSYELRAYVDKTPGRLLQGGPTSSINIGLNQSNLIAVVARGNELDLYVNHQLVAPAVSDSLYSRGQIGVFVGNIDHSADAVFSNVKVWTLP